MAVFKNTANEGLSKAAIRTPSLASNLGQPSYMGTSSNLGTGAEIANAWDRWWNGGDDEERGFAGGGDIEGGGSGGGDGGAQGPVGFWEKLGPEFTLDFMILASQTEEVGYSDLYDCLTSGGSMDFCWGNYPPPT